MRYEEFRDRWQAALRAAGVLSFQDRAQETIDVGTTSRRWKIRTLPHTQEPFTVSAAIEFHWDPLESARSYTTEEDLLTALLGRRRERLTQRRQLRVDIKLHATLPYGTTAPLPAWDLWLPWVGALDERLGIALAAKRRPTRAYPFWRGDLQLEGEASVKGEFELQAMSVAAFEMVVIPRIWDDSRRRENEGFRDKEIDRVAKRFGAALKAWTASVRQLGKWLQHAQGQARARTRRAESAEDREDGPETTH
jgi:hypothetical protein